MTPEQLAALSPEDLDALRVAVAVEQERRRDIEAIPAEIERLNRRYERAKGPSGPAWPELPDAVKAYKARNPDA